MRRRTVLVGAGATLSTALVGCLGDGPGSDHEGSGDGGDSDEHGDGNDGGSGAGPDSGDDGDGTGSDGGDEPRDDGDEDDMSIDGRLHNEDDVARTFEIAIRDGSGEVLVEDDREVDAGSTERLPAFGRPGETRTYDVSVSEASASETLALDVDPTPGKIDGYVDVTYARDGTIAIEFAPRETDDGTDVVQEDPRVDDPPHEIERPDPSHGGDWNEEYLGEHVDATPSFDFERIPVGRGILREHVAMDADEAYRVELVTADAERDEVLDLDAADEETRARLEGVDFVESVLVVVETGFGSGSVDHRWARVEDALEGLHLHGYYTDPYEGTDDLTTWVSVLEVERPDGVELARVSLTVSEDRRVHVNSTEGVVALDG